MSGNAEVYEGEIESEELDPRIPIELDRLNSLSTQINAFEKQIDEANEMFRTILSQSASQLKLIASDLGSKSIEKARPYYEILNKAREAQKMTQLAALEYQRANGIHKAAKETIKLAEAKFEEIHDSRFDAAWQEMLNHATVKVNESEAHKLESEQRHRQTASEFTRLDRLVTRLENSLGFSLIGKVRPYFEIKDKYNKMLDEQKVKIVSLQHEVWVRKESYKDSLKTLERISEEIHVKRGMRSSNVNNNIVSNRNGSINKPFQRRIFHPRLASFESIGRQNNNTFLDQNAFVRGQGSWRRLSRHFSEPSICDDSTSITDKRTNSNITTDIDSENMDKVNQLMYANKNIFSHTSVDKSNLYKDQEKVNRHSMQEPIYVNQSKYPIIQDGKMIESENIARAKQGVIEPLFMRQEHKAVLQEPSIYPGESTESLPQTSKNCVRPILPDLQNVGPKKRTSLEDLDQKIEEAAKSKYMPSPTDRPPNSPNVFRRFTIHDMREEVQEQDLDRLIKNMESMNVETEEALQKSLNAPTHTKIDRKLSSEIIMSPETLTLHMTQ